MDMEDKVKSKKNAARYMSAFGGKCLLVTQSGPGDRLALKFNFENKKWRSPEAAPFVMQKL
jgi:hypothetical protein